MDLEKYFFGGGIDEMGVLGVSRNRWIGLL
jgi:hypothetical protein